MSLNSRIFIDASNSLNPTWTINHRIFLAFLVAEIAQMMPPVGHFIAPFSIVTSSFNYFQIIFPFKPRTAKWNLPVKRKIRLQRNIICLICELLLLNEFLMLPVQLIEKRGKVKLRNKRHERGNISRRKVTISWKTSGVTVCVSSCPVCSLAQFIFGIWWTCKQWKYYH